jgi:6-phosphogluconolactonase
MKTLRLAVLSIAALALVGPARAEVRAQGGKVAVYVGTYTGPKSEGIYRFELDLATGAASAPTVAAKVTNPSFLAIHPSGKLLYSVGEIGDFGGKKTGAVTAFSIGADGNLTQLNQQSSEGSGPCHLVVDKAGKNVLVANYGGGSVACLPIKQDGSLDKASSAIQHKAPADGGPKPARAHSINLDADNRFAFAADAGLDKVFIYKFDAAKGLLSPNDPPAGLVAPQAAPRHFAFHPGGKHAYVINESAMSVTAFAYDAEKGSLTEIQTISTLPGPKEKGHSTAEIVCSPDGKFVYGSNRGHDTIAIFAVDAASGKLTAVGHEPTQGKTPRNFAIDPSGAFLLAENQGSGTIVIFKRDAATGKLTATGNVVQVGSPVCVRFLPLSK